MNITHFDSKAAEWDDNPAHVENARRIAAVIRRQIPLFRNTRALDFGCGTGLVSRELLPMIARPEPSRRAGPEQGRRGKFWPLICRPA